MVNGEYRLLHFDPEAFIECIVEKISLVDLIPLDMSAG
jgi:hypothetical protein